MKHANSLRVIAYAYTGENFQELNQTMDRVTDYGFRISFVPCATNHLHRSTLFLFNHPHVQLISHPTFLIILLSIISALVQKIFTNIPNNFSQSPKIDVDRIR